MNERIKTIYTYLYEKSEYCTKTGHDEYSCIQIRELTAEDIVKLAESLPDNGNREINIDLSQNTPYLKYYNKLQEGDK